MTASGVVIAHGSGPQGRCGLGPGQLGLGFPAPVPVYEQLAEELRGAESPDGRIGGPAVQGAPRTIWASWIDTEREEMNRHEDAELWTRHTTG